MGAGADDASLPPPPVILGTHSSDFESGRGIYYELKAGPTASQQAMVGTVLGYDFKYYGVEFSYGRSIIGREATAGTGGHVYLQYPFGPVTPFLSFGGEIIGNHITPEKIVGIIGTGVKVTISSEASLVISYTIKERHGVAFLDSAIHSFKVSLNLHF